MIVSIIYNGNRGRKMIKDKELNSWDEVIEYLQKNLEILQREDREKRAK